MRLMPMLCRKFTTTSEHKAGAVLSFEKMVSKGIAPGYASKLIQYGWETITEALKHGGERHAARRGE